VVHAPPVSHTPSSVSLGGAVRVCRSSSVSSRFWSLPTTTREAERCAPTRGVHHASDVEPLRWFHASAPARTLSCSLDWSKKRAEDRNRRCGGSLAALAPQRVVTGCLVSGHGVLDRRSAPRASKQYGEGQAQGRPGMERGPGIGLALSIPAGTPAIVTCRAPSRQGRSGRAQERDDKDW